jgi:hypothetical protein
MIINEIGKKYDLVAPKAVELKAEEAEAAISEETAEEGKKAKRGKIRRK